VHLRVHPRLGRAHQAAVKALRRKHERNRTGAAHALLSGTAQREPSPHAPASNRAVSAAQETDEMKVMRVLSSAALLVALTAAVAVAHPNSGRLERREAGRSHQRFGQFHGQRWGQLTWWEAARLRQGEAQIRRMQRLARADGIVTPRERLMIQRAKQQQMRREFRFRHNGRTA
jgi:hypothetical protein